MKTLNWKIKSIKADAEGTVVQVYWEASKEVDGITGTFAGGTPLQPPTKKDKGFINLNKLTEEDIIGWITKEIEKNDVYINHINEVINENISAQTAQTLEGDSLPWVRERK